MRWQWPTWALREDRRKERIQRKAKRVEQWHRWFAWRPVRVTNAWQTIAWLEFVARRGEYVPASWSDNLKTTVGDYWEWEYRVLER